MAELGPDAVRLQLCIGPAIPIPVPSAVIDADQIEPPGLVRREGEADLIGAQPVRQTARAGDVRRRQLRQRG